MHDTLQPFRERLDAKFTAVNQRIAAGLNTHIKITGTAEKRRWTLKYPKAEEPVNSPFYSQLPGIGIAELLWFVAAHTGYLGTFSHVLDRYVKDTPDARELLACILAMETTMAPAKLADASGISYPS